MEAYHAYEVIMRPVPSTIACSKSAYTSGGRSGQGEGGGELSPIFSKCFRSKWKRMHNSIMIDTLSQPIWYYVVDVHWYFPRNGKIVAVTSIFEGWDMQFKTTGTNCRFPSCGEFAKPIFFSHAHRQPMVTLYRDSPAWHSSPSPTQISFSLRHLAYTTCRRKSFIPDGPPTFNSIWTPMALYLDGKTWISLPRSKKKKKKYIDLRLYWEERDCWSLK